MTQQFHRKLLNKLAESPRDDYSVTLIVDKIDFSAMLSGLIIEEVRDDKITLDDDDKITTTIELEKIIEIKREGDHYYITVV